MRSLSSLSFILLFSSIAWSQGRALDWPSYGGDARRSGWQRSDLRITKENIKDAQLLWKQKLESPEAGPSSLTAPVVIGQLISYRGFKELGFVANSAGDLWSIDVDLNRVFWKKRFSSSTSSSASCPGIATTPALTPPMLFGGARRTPAPTPAPARPTSARLIGTGFGSPRPVYIVSNDGKLHQVNSSDGSDQFPPLDFLPAGARASSLTMHDNVMYATTSGKCGGETNAVWALDLAEENPRAARYALTEGEATGLGGYALGNDGTVYINTGASTLMLSPRELKLVKSLSLGEGSPKSAPTPVVLEEAGQDLVASVSPDGRIHLLSGGESIAKSERIASATGHIWGGLSAWKDDKGMNWIAAPVWGPLDANFKTAVSYGPTPNGSLVVFRVEQQSGQPTLVPAWVSPDLRSPVPPVITSGIVFALSTGGYQKDGAAWKPEKNARAMLVGLDAETGKQLYSTASQVTSPANLTGLSVANGRVYFTTLDSILYAFGIFLEI